VRYRARRHPWTFLLLLIPFLLVIFAFLGPYVSALGAGLRSDSGAELRVLPLAVFTVKLAALSTLLALALGLPGAWLLGAAEGRRASVLRALTAIPFAMPPILVVLGFVLFFGNSGWANKVLAALTGRDEGPLRVLYKPAAIILAHAFYNFPLVIRLAGDSFAAARKRYAAAAASLGASGFVTALTVFLPIALPSIFAAAFLVFLYCFTSFALVLVLGGGPGATTLAVEIYRYARVSLDYGAAGKLALAETFIAVLVFAAYIFCLSRNRAVPTQTAIPMETKDSSPAAKIFLFLYAAVIIVLVLGPLASIPLESFLSRASRAGRLVISLRWWEELGGRVLPAFGRSAFLAAVSATAAVIAGTLGAAAAKAAGRGAGGAANGGRQKSPLAALTRFGLSLPLASSGIVLGLGWTVLYGRGLSRSVPAVIALHAVSALPFAFASVSEGLAAVPETVTKAANVFGAPPLLALVTVELPMAAKSLASAWGFAAAISLGELNAVLMLGLENWETLPLLIYRAAGSYRYGTACAAGTILLLCCFGGFLVSERLGGKNVS